MDWRDAVTAVVAVAAAVVKVGFRACRDVAAAEDGGFTELGAANAGDDDIAGAWTGFTTWREVVPVATIAVEETGCTALTVVGLVEGTGLAP